MDIVLYEASPFSCNILCYVELANIFTLGWMLIVESLSEWCAKSEGEKANAACLGACLGVESVTTVSIITVGKQHALPNAKQIMSVNFFPAIELGILHKP